jgi:hypothetical protein
VHSRDKRPLGLHENEFGSADGILAWQWFSKQRGRKNVRYGSSTEVRNGVLDVGFTPKNGHYVAGGGSPDAVAPADFTLVQVNILVALLSDLNHLAKSPL